MRRSGALQTVGPEQTNTLIKMFQGHLLPISLTCLAWMMAYMFCYYGIVVFMPTLMQKSLNTPPEVVRNISVIASFVGGISYITMGMLNDVFGRRFGALLPGLSWAAMACGLYLYAHEKYQGKLFDFPIFWIYLTFVIGNSSLGVVGTWLSEIYPIDVRSTAVSFIYMAGRGIGSLAPVVVPMAAAFFGGELAIGMMVVVPAIVLFLAMTLSLPETRGRELAVAAKPSAQQQTV
jgi:SHS family lactate transporter-like MFS transporter